MEPLPHETMRRRLAALVSLKYPAFSVASRAMGRDSNWLRRRLSPPDEIADPCRLQTEDITAILAFIGEPYARLVSSEPLLSEADHKALRYLTVPRKRRQFVSRYGRSALRRLDEQQLVIVGEVMGLTDAGIALTRPRGGDPATR